ncbi:mycofactocin precursor [Streptomyces asoensis]|uniref:Mycofactocin n=1 Tax=Streptomyces asoensis TaxID=249586 RepID=A0A6M4WXK1_9ACTN|nr:mycofactocin precursor MftA [Streptomyces asoensis]QJT05254.1 mycofactocin precursor [Streptomyces asoensis]
MNELRSAQSEETVTEAEAFTEDVIEAEDLLEEISIDGMCGVY